MTFNRTMKQPLAASGLALLCSLTVLPAQAEELSDNALEQVVGGLLNVEAEVNLSSYATTGDYGWANTAADGGFATGANNGLVAAERNGTVAASHNGSDATVDNRNESVNNHYDVTVKNGVKGTNSSFSGGASSTNNDGLATVDNDVTLEENAQTDIGVVYGVNTHGQVGNATNLAANIGTAGSSSAVGFNLMNGVGVGQTVANFSNGGMAKTPAPGAADGGFGSFPSLPTVPTTGIGK